MATNLPTGKGHRGLAVRKRSKRKSTPTGMIKRHHQGGESVDPRKQGGKMQMRPLVQAVRWRILLAELGRNSTADFEVWVAASPEHRAAWRRVQSYWDLLGEHRADPDFVKARRNARNRVGKAQLGSKGRWH